MEDVGDRRRPLPGALRRRRAGPRASAGANKARSAEAAGVPEPLKLDENGRTVHWTEIAAYAPLPHRTERSGGAPVLAHPPR